MTYRENAAPKDSFSDFPSAENMRAIHENQIAQWEKIGYSFFSEGSGVLKKFLESVKQKLRENGEAREDLAHHFFHNFADYSRLCDRQKLALCDGAGRLMREQFGKIGYEVRQDGVKITISIPPEDQGP